MSPVRKRSTFAEAAQATVESFKLYLTRRLDGLLYDVRRRLGQFLHCSADDLLLVDNATWAMNIVAGSVKLGPDDEVVRGHVEVVQSIQSVTV